MATIKIINGTSGSFPEQKAQLVLDMLTITTADRGQRTYPVKHSIKSLTIVTEHKGSSVFDMTLHDGARFRGEADKKTVHHLMKYVGNAAPAAGAVKTLTAKQVSKQQWKVVAGIIVVLVVIPLLGQCTKDSPESPAQAPYQRPVATDPLDGVKAYEAFLSEDEQYFKGNKASDTDLEKIRKLLALFSGLAEQIHDAKQNTALSVEDKAYVKKVEQRLSALQQRILPGLRLALKKRAGELLWEHDVSVSVTGDRNTTIIFVGGMFSANAAIKQVQTQLNNVLMQLRFKHSRFQWHKSANGWQYKLDTPGDAEVRMFKFGTFQ